MGRQATSVRLVLIPQIKFPPVVLVLVELFEVLLDFDQVFELAGAFR